MPRESRIVYSQKAKSPRPFPKRPVLWSLGVGSFLLLLAVAGYVANLPALAVNDIDVSGGNVPAEEIRQAVQGMLEGKFLLVVPRKNFFAVSGERIADELGQRFPEIASVSVDTRFPHRIIVRAEGRHLWGVYCRREGADPPEACAYLDAEGTAYEELERFSGWLLPVIYGPAPARLGESVVPPGMLGFFGDAQAALAGIDAKLLVLSFATATPDDARFSLAEGWYLLVTRSRPVAEWVGTLRTILEREIGARRPELEYVDLRFGTKVFYKFRN
ncbi:MAG: FtsQ-type POTRA domain-containing protein [bacterium]|nr:FtsQ-type POTRA domain-containing protein [bacterium]